MMEKFSGNTFVNLMSRHTVISLLVVWILYLVIQVLTFRTGVGNEEFRDIWILQAMGNGRIPMRDFVFEYGPLGPFVWHVISHIVGIELYSIRLVVVFLGMLGIWMSYHIASRLVDDCWAAALIGFCAIGILTFPLYSYTHVLSVFTVLGALFAAMRYFDKGSTGWNVTCAVLCMLTLFVRPLPTGAALIAGIFFVHLFRLVTKRKHRFAHYLSVSVLFLAIVVLCSAIGVMGYTWWFGLPLERWGSLYFGHVIPLITDNATPLMITLPHPHETVLAFLQDMRVNPAGNFQNVIRKVSVLSNILAGHLTLLLAFLIPGVAVIISGVRRIRGAESNIVRNDQIILLSVCALGLGLLFHNGISGVHYPDFEGLGLMWNWLGGFLVQPGLIVGLSIIYSGISKKMSLWRPPHFMWLRSGFPRLVIGVIALFLVLVPKTRNFRHFVQPMGTTEASGIRGLFLNYHYEHAVIPAVEYLKTYQKELPDTIFSPLPEVLALAPQPSAFLEYYYMGKDQGVPHDEMVIEERVFAGYRGKKISASEFITSRLANTYPMVVLDRPVDALPESSSWSDFIGTDYRLHKSFVASNPANDGFSSRIFIYVPRN